MKIYQSTDRIRVAIDDIAIIVSPLTHAQRTYISTKSKIEEGRAIITFESMAETIRQSVKGLEGFKNAEGGDLELTFDDEGLLELSLAESLAEQLMGHPIHPKAIQAATKNVDKIEGAEVTVLPKQQQP